MYATIPFLAQALGTPCQHPSNFATLRMALQQAIAVETDTLQEAPLVSSAERNFQVGRLAGLNDALDMLNTLDGGTGQ